MPLKCWSVAIYYTKYDDVTYYYSVTAKSKKQALFYLAKLLGSGFRTRRIEERDYDDSEEGTIVSTF